MTDQELFQKNLELSTEFSKYLLAHPELESEIPEGVEMVFLIDSDPELSQRNLELAKTYQAKGRSVVFVRSKGLRPEISRLIDPHLEKASGF